MEESIQNEIILYQLNEKISLNVRVENETVWLTQQQIADLFGTKRPAITKHLSNIYKTGELDENTTCSILEHMGNDGMQRYATKYYNLDAILSVGYRVNSRNATMFRQWANKVLKEYLIRGYAINQRFERLEYRMATTEKKLDFILKTTLPVKEGIFYNGQIFDAYNLICDFIRMAKNRIIVIDNYVDDSVLKQLNKRNTGVSATIFTSKNNTSIIHDVSKHNQQYPPIKVKIYSQAHDRFLIIDDSIYHIGASLKDLGKKLFAFSKMECIDVNELLHNLEKETSKLPKSH